ncbi:MAG TPA: DNA polymerase III subunit gamma/tau [Planctomycetaceae bacterium]|nr:DNA polymerase III subunit gamma/tau [Planctomycetaceae bacterium]HAU47587.1 DNA polymerase III subunit gamma/tau [Planctomycetaceae bacterium]|tara:strand:+ start:759 stop:2567 length:1809 start_codon:yes stop_codon:yes gene_type:complete
MADPAAYQVVARRYRPQQFADLIGQEHVARGLAGAIDSGRVGHAYLFTGARGVGKTSAARIYAKALECTNRKSGEPCNLCERCQAISAGQDVDVIEIDAASNRGIDEIRQLRQNVAVRPASGNHKTYIIDEVHMLTREAFNALLKTLEEPPPHVKFVLCTTEPEKLPITILSRCQRFDFQSVDTVAIAQRLAQIVESEGLTVAPAALELIARRAAGSMRDSQSLLEQLFGIAAGDKKNIELEDVHAITGTGKDEKVGELAQALINRDSPAALSALHECLTQGADAGGVLEQLLTALRNCLVASVGCGPETFIGSTSCGVDFAELGKQAGTATMLAMLQIIDHSLARMRLSTHTTVLAEMAIVRLAALEDLDNLSEIISGIQPTEEKKQPLRHEKKKLTPTTNQKADKADQTAPATSSSVKAKTPNSWTADKTTTPSVGAEPLVIWKNAGELVGGLASDFAAMAASVSQEASHFKIEFPASAGSATAFLSRNEITKQFQSALETLTGQSCRYSVVLQEKGTTNSSGSIPAQNGSSSKPSTPSKKTVISSAGLLKETVQNPLVSHALTTFDAAIRKVDPPRKPVNSHQDMGEAEETNTEESGAT